MIDGFEPTKRIASLTGPIYWLFGC